eukprot:m.296818 g.296818  ORF g.296818 m.296818 type:complete len:53 (+) comp20072_c1_seq11:241-399(+)
MRSYHCTHPGENITWIHQFQQFDGTSLWNQTSFSRILIIEGAQMDLFHNCTQ